MKSFSAHPPGAGLSAELSEMPLHSLLSKQLRATGRLLLQEIRARHFPPAFARMIKQSLSAPEKLLLSPVMRGELLSNHELQSWALPVLLAACSATGRPVAELAYLPAAFWQRARAAAAAAEFLGASLDVIDDVQDGDNQLNPALALNVGLALLE